VWNLYFPLTKYDKGLRLSEENARRLIEDSQILLKNRRHHSAVYLAIQGIEEVGKALLFLKYKKDQKKITKTQWEKVFCDHKRKISEVQEKISRHLTTVKVYEGFGKSRKYLSDKRVHEMLVNGLKRNKEDFAYVNYDFEKQKMTIPTKLEIAEFEAFTKSIIIGYTKKAIIALEKEKTQKRKNIG
jgi:AbiV family abortive infection protein